MTSLWRGIVFISTEPAATTTGRDHGAYFDATLIDAPRQTQATEFYFIAHNQPDASKRGNSGSVGVFVRPGISPHIVLTPMNHSKTESLLKLAEGLTQQRQSAFSSFIESRSAEGNHLPTREGLLNKHSNLISFTAWLFNSGARLLIHSNWQVAFPVRTTPWRQKKYICFFNI